MLLYNEKTYLQEIDKTRFRYCLVKILIFIIGEYKTSYLVSKISFSVEADLFSINRYIVSNEL